MLMKIHRSVLLAAAMLIISEGAEAQVPGCSADENAVIAQYIPKMVTAVLQGNMDLFVALSQEADLKLSPQCRVSIQQQQRLQQQQQQMQQGRRQPYGGTGSGVIDHGSGAYSTPEVYCSPTSGCLPLR